MQGIAAHLLAKERRIICQWATGCGKSRVAIRFLKDNPYMNCLILVPEQDNINNWIEEFNDAGQPIANVVVACYASLHKYTDTKWDLLVLDEVPHIDTDKRIAMLRSVTGDYVLALGAVVDEEETASLEYVYGHFVKSSISLERAIEMNILPTPKVFIMHLQMDDTIRKYKYNGSSYTAAGYYRVLNRQVERARDEYNLKPNKMTRQKMLRAGNTRKRFLGSQKDDAIRRICAKLEEKDRRYLCFCSSIPQANAIGGNHAYTSKTDKSAKLLERFNVGEINSLFVVGKLIEGQNLKDVHCGVLGQIGGTERISVQAIGRIMRSKEPRVYIPIFDDTKDESFLYTVTSNIPERYIKHYKF